MPLTGHSQLDYIANVGPRLLDDGVARLGTKAWRGAVPWPGGKRETLFEDQHYRPMDSVATFLCNDRVVMCTVDP